MFYYKGMIAVRLWQLFLFILAILGDVAEAVRHARTIQNQIRRSSVMDSAELHTYAKELQVPYELLKKTSELGRLPVVNFAAGGLGMYPFENSVILRLWAKVK